MLENRVDLGLGAERVASGPPPARVGFSSEAPTL